MNTFIISDCQNMYTLFCHPIHSSNECVSFSIISIRFNQKQFVCRFSHIITVILWKNTEWFCTGKVKSFLIIFHQHSSMNLNLRGRISTLLLKRVSGLCLMHRRVNNGLMFVRFCEQSNFHLSDIQLLSIMEDSVPSMAIALTSHHSTRYTLS